MLNALGEKIDIASADTRVARGIDSLVKRDTGGAYAWSLGDDWPSNRRAAGALRPRVTTTGDSLRRRRPPLPITGGDRGRAQRASPDDMVCAADTSRTFCESAWRITRRLDLDAGAPREGLNALGRRFASGPQDRSTR